MTAKILTLFDKCSLHVTLFIVCMYMHKQTLKYEKIQEANYLKKKRPVMKLFSDGTKWQKKR